MRLFFALLSAGLLLFALTAQAHDSWLSRNGLRNHAGEWCCGEGDCALMDKGSVVITSRGYEVHGFGTIGDGPGAKRVRVDEVVPASEAQPSPDGEYWRCQRPNGSRRCFFFPPPNT
jgi:hypothetical protein